MRKELLDSNEKPMYLLSNKPELLDKLLDFLVDTNSDLVKEMWELLKELPKNEIYSKKFEKITPKGEEIKDWVEYLGYKDISDFPRIVYSLYVFASVIEKNSAKKEIFLAIQQSFYEKKGFQFLFNLFNSYLQKKNSAICIKLINYCLHIMILLWQNDKILKIYEAETDQSAIWESIMNIVFWLGTSMGNTKFDSLIDISFQGELLDNSMKMLLNIVSCNPKKFEKLLISKEFIQTIKFCFMSENETVRIKLKQSLLNINDIVIKTSEHKAALVIDYLNILIDIFMELAINATAYSAEYFDLLIVLAVIINLY